MVLTRNRVATIAGWIFLLVTALVIVTGIYSYTGKGHLNAVEAAEKLRNGEITAVVDVRTDLEWELGHYPGAVHIPITEFDRNDRRVRQLLSQSAGGILVYCNTGQRARRAADLLRSYGTRVPVYYLVDSYSGLLSN